MAGGGAPLAGKAMGILQGMGYSRAGSAAIMGNAGVESAGWHTNIGQGGTSQTANNLGSGAGGYGLFQWTDPGRQQGLAHYAASHGQNVRSLNAQLGFANQELGSYPGLQAALKRPGNVNALTSAVENQYERPAAPGASIGERQSYAHQAFNLGGQGGGNGPVDHTGGLVSPFFGGNAPHQPTAPHDHTGGLESPFFNSPGASVQGSPVDHTGGLASPFFPNQGAQPQAHMAAAQPHAGQSGAFGIKLLGSGVDANGTTPSDAETAGNILLSGTPKQQAEWNTVMKSANFINNQHFNYEWGGGHNSSFAPTHGTGHGSGSGIGYDCSGTVSRILMKAGLMSASLGPQVSGNLENPGALGIKGAVPGIGTGPRSLTVFANGEHTYMKIGDQYYGTSSQNPGGGAGWIGKTSENNNAAFTAWHVNL